MAKKQVTIEGLAGMIKRGFDEIESKMDRKAEVDKQFADVTDRLDRIEKLILADHKRRSGWKWK